MPRVSFDFDDTLTEEGVWQYAADLVKKGVDVWIVTARLDDEQIMKRFGKEFGGKIYVPSNAGNRDLYKLADEIGISVSNIKFTNLAGKGKWFKKHPNFEWHLEDSPKQIFDIENESSVPAINVLSRNWKEQCEELLKNRDYHGYLKNSGT
jgi:hypothetical protein